MTTPSIDEQLAALVHGCEQVYSPEELREKLVVSARTATPLRVKLGMDPTAPDIHLGHTVVLRKLRQFQDLGHKAILIIGDYTAMVGDPTGRNQTRPMLGAEAIEENARTYFEQAGKVLDTRPDKLEIRRNSEWLGPMNFADVLRLASKKTVARMLERDTFEKRFKAGHEIGIHEMLYPLMQGHDSVVIRADVELGATDQTFNNLVGRDLQKMDGQAPQVVVILPILVGLDGTEKMSKSLGNYVGVNDTPDEMFGKLMSISDTMMPNYYARLTELPASEYQPLIASNPRDAKVALARRMVATYHDEASARRVEEEFFRKAKGGVPDDVPEQTIPASELTGGRLSAVHLAVLCGFAESNAEARRLIREGGLRVNAEKVDDPNAEIAVEDGMIVQRGKRRFVKLKRG